MKTQILTIAVAALISGNVWAGPVSIWEGSGSVYSPSGKIVDTYRIKVVNSETSTNVIQSETTTTMSDGSQKTISQTIQVEGGRWTVESNLGKGGGGCYGVDLCENYISGDDGKAYATTIVQDSPNNRRNITFVLENGKATKVLKDCITKVL